MRMAGASWWAMNEKSHPALSRRLNLPLLTFYGLGTTIGAGIFVLVGEVAGRAGMAAPVSFLAASLLAAFTAFSFAELVARYPRSAGEAIYVREGFRSRRLALASRSAWLNGRLMQMDVLFESRRAAIEGWLDFTR